mmetsp:Transcript_27213/g.83858  ORF Transcript_27213/g.83858 Transcript_27213/m.83858 type:complete len:95 (+) Transcript_27213:146-430(+)
MGAVVVDFEAAIVGTIVGATVGDIEGTPDGFGVNDGGDDGAGVGTEDGVAVGSAMTTRAHVDDVRLLPPPPELDSAVASLRMQLPSTRSSAVTL